MDMKFKFTVCFLFSLLVAGCVGDWSQTNTTSSKMEADTSSYQTATYWVAPEQVPCQGVVPIQCLLVNNVVDGQLSQWQFFYNDIEGFDFVSGVFYKLELALSEIADLAADASSIHYKLVRKIEHPPRSYLANTTLIESRQWNLKQLLGLAQYKPESLRKAPYVVLSGAGFHGFSGCNQMFGQVQYLFEATDAKNALLKLGPIGSTLMACSDPMANKVEHQLQQTLSVVNRFEVQWPFLNIYKDEQLMAQFVAEDWD
ncbi:MAG: heat shock protein HslJ [Moritella sp.]|jgi:heat shock protein HslJ